MLGWLTRNVCIFENFTFKMHRATNKFYNAEKSITYKIWNNNMSWCTRMKENLLYHFSDVSATQDFDKNNRSFLKYINVIVLRYIINQQQRALFYYQQIEDWYDQQYIGSQKAPFNNLSNNPYLITINFFNTGVIFGGHVRLVFTLVLFIYIACVFITLTSFPEMPLDTLENTESGNQENILFILC